MILYHGSNFDFRRIDLNKCKPYKDFGKGFYLTTIFDQAAQMAIRMTRFYPETFPYIHGFEFDERILEKKNNVYTVKIFEKPDIEWAEFIINNRNKKFSNILSKERIANHNHDNKYDIVVGPVADDDIAILLNTFTKGYINLNELARKLEYSKVNNQYSFHTERAIKLLNRIEVTHE